MVFDEQELRQHLESVAARVSAPRFTTGGVIGRVRRRRARIIGLVSGALLIVAAIAVAVPVALSGTSTPPTVVPSKLPFRLSFTVAVNGQSRVFPKNGPPPSFVVTPGENLSMNIGVIVPAHARVTTLWLGVARGAFGSGRSRPIGVHPILAHSRKPLTPGLHTFRLRWTVPAGLHHGTTLVATWTARQAGVGQIVAVFVMPG